MARDKRTARVKTAAPTQKVFAGALAGALTVVIAWALREVWKIDIPGEVASAVTVILTFITSWFTPPSPDEIVEEVEG
jgi:hypothetical protein